ncbi:hypothetical protein T01_4464 [Trichinella spiralis]|uniref:Uncharacterized protein n=1 Tax=Trichinella spiralis TaxID=6334 RepID=A0A0V1AXB1_TRISP|nr:hypothetical protein T01_4464 [Trichinella spiralis]
MQLSSSRGSQLVLWWQSRCLHRSVKAAAAACNSAWPIVKSAQPDRPGYVDQ